MATASTLQPAYPVGAVLDELKAVCMTDYREAKQAGFVGPTADAVEYWQGSAQRNGWQAIRSDSPELERKDSVALHNISTLNHALFGSFGPPLSTAVSAQSMLGGQVFKKSVAGRSLYLSVFGADDGGERRVGECRIHDLLGDGIAKNPISSEAVSKLAEAKPRRSNGPFGSERYAWPATQPGKITQLDIHLSFKGWLMTPFSQKIEPFNPYVPYGLTIVAGFHEHDILV